MRKVIAIVILIGLGALLWINPSIYNKKHQNDEDKLYDSIIEEDEILQLVKADKGILNLPITDLQSSPEEIINFNAMLMKVMYSVETLKNDEVLQKLTEEEIRLLAGVQREYYHDDLLEVNPEILHLRGVAIAVEKAVAEKEWIVDYKVASAIYDPNNQKQATVLVTFIPSFSDGDEKYDINMRYLLERISTEDGELWFIKGWVGGADDVIVE